MITEAEIYWVTRMSYLQGFALTISIILCACCITGAIISCVQKYAAYRDERKEMAKRVFKWFLPATLISIVLVFGAILIPNTKEYCAIKVIPVIANDEQVQELPNKVVELTNEWIDAQRTSFADELKPDKEN